MKQTYLIQIHKSSNSFGDQIVTAYLRGAEGMEMFNFHATEGSWMSERKIVAEVARQAKIEIKSISLKAVSNE